MFALKSFAKINLGLEITGRRDDGYHDLKTIFQTIDFFDVLEIKENHTQRNKLSGDMKDLDWGKGNTISRAFDLIYRNFNLKQGFDVWVKKNIPPGSGLGGGSSNAAVILLFLNGYFDLKISAGEMIDLGKRIGADVPFFFVGGTVFAEGVGDVMTEITSPVDGEMVLVIPRIRVSTGLIFSGFDLTSCPFKSKIDVFLKSRNTNILENSLEPITFQLFPEMKRIKEKMQTFGKDRVLMSGSGSALFCFTKNCDMEGLKKAFPSLILTRTIHREYYQNNIGAWPSGKASVFGAEMRRFESSRPRSLK